MALTFQAYPGDLLGLAESLEGALYTFEETRDAAFGLVDGQLTVHGPFPVFTSRPDDIEDDRNAKGDIPALPSGWRALVATDEQPLALVEIVFDAAGTELYSIRGPEAAIAFWRVLSAAMNHLDGPGAYEVRWLAVPDIYVSALWLAAPEPIFLPARLGSAFRPEAREIRWSQLRDAILPLIEAARPGPGFVDRDDGSPRSGLPRRG